MFKIIKRNILKMFREFLVYHHSSMEYRAKILTLMVSSDDEIDECEKQKLKEIACRIYSEDAERAELLVDTVMEYHNKIITMNGLDFDHLVWQVTKETKEVRRFAQKIDLDLLKELHECAAEDEENYLFQERILEFLEELKEEYGKKDNAKI